jgi:hypothetical protein
MFQPHTSQFDRIRLAEKFSTGRKYRFSTGGSTCTFRQDGGSADRNVWGDSSAVLAGSLQNDGARVGAAARLWAGRGGVAGQEIQDVAAQRVAFGDARMVEIEFGNAFHADFFHDAA